MTKSYKVPHKCIYIFFTTWKKKESVVIESQLYGFSLGKRKISRYRKFRLF